MRHPRVRKGARGPPHGSPSGKDAGKGTGLVVKQCVVVLDGSGSDCGAAPLDTPRCLLPVDGAPFLALLLGEARRRGFTHALLLASDRQEAAVRAALPAVSGPDIAIDLITAPEACGPDDPLIRRLGAALPRLDEVFLLLDGASWFDFNWLDLLATTLRENTEAGVALRGGDDPAPGTTGAPVDGHVQVLRRSAIERAQRDPHAGTSPGMAGPMTRRAYEGAFIDLRTPGGYAAAQARVPAQRRRPAVFFDRDGVLNVDTGYVHAQADLTWIPGAKAAVKRFNDLGYYTFVVTNQAGIARGYYGEAEVLTLHAWMQEELRAAGACMDDWRYCPYHPEGTVDRYRQAHPWRKPAPGMLQDLAAHWPVDMERSLLIGDRGSDLDAATAAGIAGHLFTGGDLLRFVEGLPLAGAHPSPNR